MKTKIIILAVTLFVGAQAYSIQTQSATAQDTTVYFNQKIIQIADSAEQIKVTVLDSQSTPLVQVYKGIFTEDSSFEQYSVETQVNFDFPFKKRKSSAKLHGHFVSVGFGKLYTTDNLTDFNHVSNMKISNSNELFWNPFGYTIPFVKGYLGMTTGLGMTWRNLHLGNNTHLVNENDLVIPKQAPEGVSYYYSRLRTFDVNVPLYLEIQPTGRPNFFISAGVLFGVNTFSSYKVKYKNEMNKKVKSVEGKDYNVNPFSLTYVAQIGWRDFGIYAKWTPTPFFKQGKGPDVQTAAVGLALYL